MTNSRNDKTGVLKVEEIKNFLYCATMVDRLLWNFSKILSADFTLWQWHLASVAVLITDAILKCLLCHNQFVTE